jgi:hypothetical protein
LINNNCVKCPAGCSNCSSANVCTLCSNPTTTALNANNGDVSCVAINNFNCQTAVSSLCTVCSQGYYLDSTNPNIPKCTVCDISCKTCTAPTTCQSCVDTYYLSANNCLPC